jgi:hypothetical protein
MVFRRNVAKASIHAAVISECGVNRGVTVGGIGLYADAITCVPRSDMMGAPRAHVGMICYDSDDSKLKVCVAVAPGADWRIISSA